MKTIMAALGCAALLAGCAVEPVGYGYGYSAPYAYGYDYGPYYAPGYYGYYDYGPTIGFSYYGGHRFDHRDFRDHGRFHADAGRHWHATTAPAANRWSGRVATAPRPGARSGPTVNRAVHPTRTQPAGVARAPHETRPVS
jgi:hypothetical protein